MMRKWIQQHSVTSCTWDVKEGDPRVWAESITRPDGFCLLCHKILFSALYLAKCYSPVRLH